MASCEGKSQGVVVPAFFLLAVSVALSFAPAASAAHAYDAPAPQQEPSDPDFILQLDQLRSKILSLGRFYFELSSMLLH
jgi:hypothetical protein